MSRCSFFTLDVSFYDNDWWESVPDKDKSKFISLDVLLNGLVMRTYDIPTYNGDKQPPQVLRERGICIEIPETKKILSFRTISQYIGWKKPKIIEVMELLEKYGVITFHILKNNQVEINHLKALNRLHPLQQKFFNRLGISVKKSDMKQTKKRNETESEVKKPIADDSPREEESQQINSPRKITPHLEEVNRKREEIKNRRK
ncbi:MAG: hypothetical protein H8E55_16245 [Pelagibacterales bacterium]|nr:hypothetical protein [Pelagibacterales bacterium]